MQKRKRISNGVSGRRFLIQEFVKSNLSKYECPREIEFVEGLPKTTDGKIKRKELREKERIRKGSA
jgi:acetyl-CoA synthetase